MVAVINLPENISNYVSFVSHEFTKDLYHYDYTRREIANISMNIQWHQTFRNVTWYCKNFFSEQKKS